MRTLTLPQAETVARVEGRVGSQLEGPPVRVCFLIDELAAAGTESQLLALIRNLDRTKVNPYLVLLRGENVASRSLEPESCPVLRLDVGALRSPATLMKAFRFIRFLRRERIDVVQAYFPDSSYLGIPCAWLAGVSHRVRTRNNVGHWVTATDRFLGRALNLLTTATIANCNAARLSLLRDERPKPESVFILENGVDLERFLGVPGVRKRSPREPAVIGAVANLRHVKGLDVLVEAVAMLVSQGRTLTLCIAGEGEQRDELTRTARAGNVPLELPGSLRDIPAFLSGLDIAVLPSRAEGMSNAVLEYMAAGRPIVATAVGAAPDVLLDGECGFLVHPESPVALATALASLLEDPERAARIGGAARKRARERYSRQAMVRRFEDFYAALVA